VPAGWNWSSSGDRSTPVPGVRWPCPNARVPAETSPSVVAADPANSSLRDHFAPWIIEMSLSREFQDFKIRY
jgi:hypothetical protein